MQIVELKMMAMEMAVQARQPDDHISVVYETGQSIFEWLMEGTTVVGDEDQSTMSLN